jgi:c-di-AMP phosphodiesterase-like protein
MINTLLETILLYMKKWSIPIASVFIMAVSILSACFSTKWWLISLMILSAVLAFIIALNEFKTIRKIERKIDEVRDKKSYVENETLHISR